MTDQEINIAVAEACGWERWKSSPESSVVCLKKPTPSQRAYWIKCGNFITADPVNNPGDIPNYCRDLNSMHEAEKVLTPDQEFTYVSRLGGMIMESAYEDDPRWTKSHLSSGDSTYRATARQRAEAFLRAVGKWKEAQ